MTPLKAIELAIKNGSQVAASDLIALVSRVEQMQNGLRKAETAIFALARGGRAELRKELLAMADADDIKETLTESQVMILKSALGEGNQNHIRPVVDDQVKTDLEVLMAAGLLVKGGRGLWHVTEAGKIVVGRRTA